MGFLNFGKKKSAQQIDADLDDLTVEEADFLRRLFAEMWPASEGTITLHGEYAQSSSGGQFGLYNLSRAVKLEPQQNWPQVVERHISGLLSRGAAPKDAELTDDEVLSLVKARLVPSTYLPESHREAFTYRRTIADGLEAILMLDFPETTSAIPDAIVSRFEADSLWSTAIAAVTAEPLGEIQTVDAGSGPFAIAITDSMFTASHVLDLPALLTQAGIASAPQGVLFAVPSRHHLAFHVVESVSAIHVAHEMSQFAQMAFGQGVGEISPNIYYWSDAGYEQVTSVDQEGNLRVDGTGAFFSAVNSF
ncbi:hypothetical protein [Microbacterium sp. EST19A]|uniref:hypothetical protein n=1 Tax=Microbacterium sp. EST19A TaxID=2862681 RepID=UPI001CBB7890|nr:hypothetical protein [Microbacterium sp. EST19A]